MMQPAQPHQNTFTVVIKRPNRHHSWGLRIAGGCDLDSPIVITKVYPGTPAAAELKRGDIIRKIGDYDSRDLRHKDATNFFQSSDTSISLGIQRNPPGEKKAASGSRSVTPLPIVDYCQKESKASSASMSVVNSFHDFLDHQHVHRAQAVASPFELSSEHDLNYVIKEQPYRTTPLVLPGAKVKKENPPTESYLRHHPNPMMRASPGHYEFGNSELSYKQKVADSVLNRVIPDSQSNPNRHVVNRPYNTPIGLYSEQNIVDSINHQYGHSVPHPPQNTPLDNEVYTLATTTTLGRNAGSYLSYKKTVVYDPAKSETFKALQEEELVGGHVQEIPQPVQPKVFAPPKTYTKGASPQPHPTSPHPNANFGMTTEEIHQSNSFKRLMHMVLE
ncbi:PDZ and LIM domain protein 3 isoform X1 [Diaphorina citri]|uniref:PDZ and LIM domain protein 3 isoform X1 n=1 Tax=Diaphorina citri TaxID=121845 RepID=A0A1S3DG36_DIACI|nr:PDZ and LIM domain protein 3 isoform X1 [Diaphorina citri]